MWLGPHGALSRNAVNPKRLAFAREPGLVSGPLARASCLLDSGCAHARAARGEEKGLLKVTGVYLEQSQQGDLP